MITVDKIGFQDCLSVGCFHLRGNWGFRDVDGFVCACMRASL